MDKHELQKRITAMKKRLTEAELDLAGVEEQEQLSKLIKIECEYCDGRGFVDGSQFNEAPFEEVCRECEGKGYTCMKPYKDLIEYCGNKK